jgi:hypothetical protein
MRFSDFRNGGSKSVFIQTKRVNLINGQTYSLNKNMVDNGDFSGGGGAYW